MFEAAEKRRERVACAAKAAPIPGNAAPKLRESLVCGDVFGAGKGAGDEWCCWGGLNSRPQPYQGCALPLSYSSQPFVRVRRPLSGPGRGALLAGRAGAVKDDRSFALSFASNGGIPPVMDRKPAESSREERLAAKLRENLRRRKAQARELDADGQAAGAGGNDGNPALPKAPPKS